MVFTFCTPWKQAEACEAIKGVVLSLNGTIKDLGRGRLVARWKTNLKKTSVFDHICTFYVADGTVRAVTDHKDTEMIVMVFRRMTTPLAFWDIFLGCLIRRYPDVDFGVDAGIPELVAIQFLDNGTEQVLVTKTIHHPSLAGAALGGMLFGTAGAIVGGLAGKSYITTTTQSENSKLRTAMVRYSNGLVFRGKMINNGSLYHEIMVNMDRLSEHC